MSSAQSNGDAGTSPLPQVVVDSHRTLHPFFTPTHVGFSRVSQTDHGPQSEWSSRRARKGRYQRSGATLMGIQSSGNGKSEGGRLEGLEERIEREIVGRVKNEESKLKPGLRMDISWWEAVAFTFGSAVWVVNGFTVWFPILRPPLATRTFSYTAAGLAFIGGTVFEIGSYLMVVEALDRGREISFGTALGQLLHHRRGVRPDATEKVDAAQQSNSRNGSPSKPNGTSDPKKGQTDEKDLDLRSYVWWGKPMWHDLGYCAAIVQLFAATVFWISTITGLPGVIPGFFSDSDSKAIVDVFFWTPQVIGGSGFIVSSIIIMLEVQHAWWKINPLDIGWQVGFWNLIGAIGFTLCGAFGYSSSSGMEYESALATFWGSWAFLIGSGCQIWEVIWREPA